MNTASNSNVTIETKYILNVLSRDAAGKPLAMEPEEVKGYFEDAASPMRAEPFKLFFVNRSDDPEIPVQILEESQLFDSLAEAEACMNNVLSAAA